MVSRKPTLISDRTIAGLHDVFGRGMTAVEKFQDPPPEVTFVRRNPTTGAREEVLTVTLIRIGFPARDERVIVTGGAVERQVVGQLRGWAPLPIERDDLFLWDGQRCRVTTVYPERFGMVRADFELEQ